MTKERLFKALSWTLAVVGYGIAAYLAVGVGVSWWVQWRN